MIDLDWLSDRLCDVLQWQLANPDATDGPDVPFAGRRVWGIFLELNATRAVGMAANPIAFAEIEAWSRMRREPVRPFELTMLRALDRAYLEAARAKQDKPEKPVISARPFSFELFDAQFG